MSEKKEIKRECILIIGNGFDLAHNLPTSYVDFLDFTIVFCSLYIDNDKDFKSKYTKFVRGNADIKKRLVENFESRRNLSYKESVEKGATYSLNDIALDFLFENLNNNIWYKYFIRLRNRGIYGQNWVDFEREIAEIIKWMETNCKDVYQPVETLFNIMNKPNKKVMKIPLFLGCIDVEKYTSAILINDFINELYVDLERLSCALEGYLRYFVETIPVEAKQIVKDISPKYVISFNYTDTYTRIYDSSAEVCYIHGKCRKEVLTYETDIVLGIDETLPFPKRNIRTEFAIFKKFVQRIRKKNDRQYLKWIEAVACMFGNRQNGLKTETYNKQEYTKGISSVYVYGHSLDITDHDILKKLMKPEYFSLHFYPLEKTGEGQLISNLIRIIDEDTLIEKNNGSLLEFTIVDKEGNKIN